MEYQKNETQIHAQMHRYETHQHSNSKWRHQSALGLVILCVSLHNITQFLIYDSKFLYIFINVAKCKFTQGIVI